MFMLALKRGILLLTHTYICVGPEKGHNSKLAAIEQRLKKLTDARMFPEASIECRSSFTSCVGYFG
jgi:hypothetical protein